jgi:hypothetical protein
VFMMMVGGGGVCENENKKIESITGEGTVCT